MKSNLDITQLAFEYLRHNNSGLNVGNEAEFLVAVQKARARFADLLELSPSELQGQCRKGFDLKDFDG
ncbi:YdiH family protein [Lelliottia wanjuensis]|uniref:YdiH family protein n=1 Tax=Lelliottia wanjuensis TaxID=3050585 RepID=UPI003306CBA1